MSRVIESGIALRPFDRSPLENTIVSDPLLPRIAAGDASAVKDCVGRYGALVWSLARRLTSSSSDAEDAVQEIFIQVWQNAAQFNPHIASESTFIAMIARRRLIDRLRRAQSAPPRPSLEEQAWEPVAENTKDPLELADEITKVRACWAKLSLHAQNVLQLSIYDGVPHSDIASNLGIPLGTVKSFARRGLLSLRECMNRPFSRLSEEQPT
jgi:RNA polymerase sigma-70 factor (ECF subfamily)